jgi:creatinine amidohydrolase
MPGVQYEEMFPWEIARAIADAPVCYVPLGVLEWHGEHNAVGLDAIKVHALCVEAARRCGGVVVPPLYWATDEREDLGDGAYLTGGVEHGERYHVPGNMFWLRPQTFHDLLLDMYEAMRRRGFRAIVVLTGHWSRRVHLPTLEATGREFLAGQPTMRWVLFTDQQLAEGLPYPWEHAAGGETSLLLATRPDLVDLAQTLETDRGLRAFYERANPEHLARRGQTTHKYIGVLRGVEEGAGDGASNDPELTASVERGMLLFSAIAERLAERSRAALDEALSLCGDGA